MMKKALFIALIIFAQGCGFEYNHLERAKSFLRTGRFNDAINELAKLPSDECERNYGLLIANLGVLAQMGGSLMGTVQEALGGGLFPLSETLQSLDPLLAEVLGGVKQYLDTIKRYSGYVISNPSCEFDPGGPIPLVIKGVPELDIAFEGVWTNSLAWAVDGIIRIVDGLVTYLKGINYDLNFSQLMELFEEVYASSNPAIPTEPYFPKFDIISILRALARAVGDEFLNFHPNRYSGSDVQTLFREGLEKLAKFVDPDDGVFFSPQAQAGCDPEVDFICYKTCPHINIFDISEYRDSDQKCIALPGFGCWSQDQICGILNILLDPDWLRSLRDFLQRLKGPFAGQTYRIGLSEFSVLIPSNISALLSQFGGSDMALNLSFPATLSIYINKLIPESPEVGVPPSAFLPAVTEVAYPSGGTQVVLREFMVEGEVGENVPPASEHVKSGDSPHFAGTQYEIPRDCIAPPADSTDRLVYLAFNHPGLKNLILVNLDNINAESSCSLPSEWNGRGWSPPDSFALNAVLNDMLLRIYSIINALKTFIPTQ